MLGWDGFILCPQPQCALFTSLHFPHCLHWVLHFCYRTFSIPVVTCCPLLLLYCLCVCRTVAGEHQVQPAVPAIDDRVTTTDILGHIRSFVSNLFGCHVCRWCSKIWCDMFFYFSSKFCLLISVYPTFDIRSGTALHFYLLPAKLTFYPPPLPPACRIMSCLFLFVWPYVCSPTSITNPCNSLGHTFLNPSIRVSSEDVLSPHTTTGPCSTGCLNYTEGSLSGYTNSNWKIRSPSKLLLDWVQQSGLRCTKSIILHLISAHRVMRTQVLIMAQVLRFDPRSRAAQKSLVPLSPTLMVIIRRAS